MDLTGQWKVKAVKGAPWFMTLFNKIEDVKHIKGEAGHNEITSLCGNPRTFFGFGQVLSVMLPIQWGHFTIKRNYHALTKDTTWPVSLMYDNMQIIDTLMPENEDLLHGQFYLSHKNIIISDKNLHKAKHVGDFDMIRI